MFLHEDEEDVIERMVEEMYPSKMGFSWVNENERDAYRRGLQAGKRLRNSRDD